MRSFFFHPHVEFDGMGFIGEREERGSYSWSIAHIDHPNDNSSSAESSDPQALKDSILQRPEQVEPEPVSNALVTMY